MAVSDINMYLGSPGRLESIVVPKGTVDHPRVRQVDVYALGNGGMRVGKLLGGARRITISYQRLQYDDFKKLEAYEQGHRGPGPFVLLDPGIRNILTVNQSSTTSERNNTNNFTLSGSGGALASNATVYRRGPRTLSWTASNTNPSASAILLDTPAPEWSGFPVHVGRSMVLSAYVKGGGTDSTVSVSATMRWLSEGGSTLSSNTGSIVVTSSGSWQQVLVAATPPASAAYVTPIFTAASGAGAGDIVYFDEMMLHEGTTVDSTWSPGGGILPVAPLSLADGWPFQAGQYRERPVFILQEVGGGG